MRGALAVLCLVGLLAGAPVRAAPAPPLPPARVLLFAFDNTALADIRRMPALWSFLEPGALSTTHHTVLPTRSAPGFAAIAGGRYADRSGALDNGFFAGGERESGFTFWETRLGSGLPFGLGEPPWAAFNRAGFDMGAVGMSPLVLQTDADVRRLARMANPQERRPPAYRGVSIYRADGTREFGTPDIPWLWPEVGPFPGWPLRAVEFPLTVTALMHEHGIPVTFTYLENLRGAAPPGGYDDVISRYDAAFAALFARLAAVGVTPDNSLFIFTTDEGDYLSVTGGRTVALGSFLEQHASLPPEALALAGGAAANLYLLPGYDTAGAAAAAAQAPGVAAVAWGAALRATHTMVHADPARTPSLTVYGEPDVQFRDRGRAVIGRTGAPLWNHGTLGESMERVWLAARGPGIRPGPLTAWTDHTDLLPTILHLVGVPDAGLDGRVIAELLDEQATPPAVRSAEALVMAAVFKQCAAPLGLLTHSVLRAVTTAARDGDPAAMAQLDGAITALMDRRDALTAQAREMLRALLAGEPLSPEVVTDLARRLLALMADGAAVGG